MRNSLLTLGLLALGMQAVAQNYSHSYNRTVFNDAATQSPIEAGLIESTRAQVTRNFPGWHISLDKVSGTFNDIFGNAFSVPGGSNEVKALYVMDNYLKDLGINSAEWHKVRDMTAPKAAYVDFEQSFNNHPVVFARLSFRFTKDGRLVRIKNTSYGTPGNVSAKLGAQDVLQANAIMDGINSVNVTNTTIATDWVWFPIPAGAHYELHPAWKVSVSGNETESNQPVELEGYIDATNGELLYRTNKVEEAADVTVKGMVYATNTITPATLEPLANLQVVVNNGVPVNVDASGFIADGSPNITVDFALQGLWSKVVVAGGVGTPAFSAVPFTGTGNVYTFPNTGSSSDRAVNAYYHTTRVHDFMKPYFPGFTDLDFPLTTNVDVTSGTCNAFFSGTSINFYAAGGGCKSFAEIGDIIYHEYGHGINSYFYGSQNANFRNGALGEGTADVWGMSISRDSVLGRNTSTPTSYIRRYDINPKVYPMDIKGEVHADGEIIAGAWYDFAKNVDSFPLMTDLFTSTYYDLPNGPNGAEGEIYHDVLISALLNDDDDADFSNGTPHFAAITSAFAKHGIYLLADAVLNHTELAHQPANTPIDVTATLTLVNPEFFQSLKLIYKKRNTSAWDTLTMTNNNGTFSATIPGQASGSIIDYYFHVYDVLSIPSATFPNSYFSDPSEAYRSNLPYQFGVGIHVTQKTTFDDGTGEDWTAGGVSGDNATSGKWILIKPTGTYTNGTPVQTSADHTTGNGKCMVTGNSTGSSINSGDVDGGKTTLMTPPLDLSGYVYPMIEYYRWFSNDKNSGYNAARKMDPWQVQIRSNNSIIWYNVENTLQSDNSWRRRIFALDEYLPVRTDITMRFVASDKVTTNEQTVEAAVDDFFLYDGVPLSVNDVAPAKASIYPNPADDRIQVVMPAPVKGTMTLYDALGRSVSAYQLDGANTHFVISTAGYTSGNYTLLIQTDNKTIQSSKVVISHR